MERPVGGSWRRLEEVHEHPAGRVLEPLVAGDPGREEDALAVGRGVRDAVVIGDHAQPAVVISAQHRRPGHPHDHVPVAPLEECLHGHALLPGLPLHRQHGQLGLPDERVGGR